MNLPRPQIEISAQVWVCDACGSQDHKSCGCNATAHMEALLEKRAQDRERQRRHRENIKQINDPVTRDPNVEKIEESSGASAGVTSAPFYAADERERWAERRDRNQLEVLSLMRTARHAIECAKFEGAPTRDLLRLVRKAA